MLVQDHLTGQFHEVADDGVTYDGFGNPVGFPPLLPILSSLAPVVLPGIMKAIGFNGPEYGYGDDEFGDQVPQGQVVYDGLGNPVGFAPLLNIAKNVLPAAARFIAPIAQKVASAVTAGPGALMNVLNPAAQAAGQALTSIAPAMNQAAAAIPSNLPMPMPMPGMPHLPFPRPMMPPGWHRPPVPYTGAQPRRAYMRCAVWPGPRGLVPVAPGTAVPVMTPVAPAAAPPTLRRRRRR